MDRGKKSRRYNDLGIVDLYDSQGKQKGKFFAMRTNDGIRKGEKKKERESREGYNRNEAVGLQIKDASVSNKEAAV